MCVCVCVYAVRTQRGAGSTSCQAPFYKRTLFKRPLFASVCCATDI